MCEQSVCTRSQDCWSLLDTVPPPDILEWCDQNCRRRRQEDGRYIPKEKKEKGKDEALLVFMFRSEGRRFGNTCSKVGSRYKRRDRANLPLESTGEVESGLPSA